MIFLFKPNESQELHVCKFGESWVVWGAFCFISDIKVRLVVCKFKRWPLVSTIAQYYCGGLLWSVEVCAC